MVPSSHLTLVGRTITFPVITIADLDDSPLCHCGERLVLSMPDDSDDIRLIGVCPSGCEPWCVVEILHSTVL